MKAQPGRFWYNGRHEENYPVAERAFDAGGDRGEGTGSGLIFGKIAEVCRYEMNGEMNGVRPALVIRQVPLLTNAGLTPDVRQTFADFR